MFVALLSVFTSGVLYVRTNELEEQIAQIKRERKVALRSALDESSVSVSHHRSGERPRGALVVHNMGKGAATNVTVHVHRTAHPSPTPVIPGNVVAIERLGGGQRMTIDTTTERDDVWPIDVLVTWDDARGPQSVLRSVSR